MSKSAMIRARIEPKLKEEVEAVLDKLGLSATDAINLLYHQIKIKKGLPFEVRLPNKTTKRTIEKARKGKNITHFDTKEEMFQHLGI